MSYALYHEAVPRRGPARELKEGAARKEDRRDREEMDVDRTSLTAEASEQFNHDHCTADPSEVDPHSLAAVRRVLSQLQRLPGRRGHPIPLSEVVERSGQSKNTVHQVLQVLVREGAVYATDTHVHALL